jgi:hypothetical protein
MLSLATELRKHDHSGSLLVLPEAFNISCEYFGNDEPNTDPAILCDLQKLCTWFDVSVVTGLIISTPQGPPGVPHSGAYLIDSLGSELMCYKRCNDGSRKYAPCDTQCDFVNGISYKGLSLGALVCMDSYRRDLAAAPDAEIRHKTLKTKLSKNPVQQVICVPALTCDSTPERFSDTWANCYVVIANGCGVAAKRTGSAVVKKGTENESDMLCEFTEKRNRICTVPINTP